MALSTVTTLFGTRFWASMPQTIFVTGSQAFSKVLKQGPVFQFCDGEL